MPVTMTLPVAARIVLTATSNPAASGELPCNASSSAATPERSSERVRSAEATAVVGFVIGARF